MAKFKSVNKLIKRLNKDAFTVADVIKMLTIMRPYRTAIPPGSVLNQRMGESLGWILRSGAFSVEIPADRDVLRVGNALLYASKTGVSSADTEVRKIPEIRAMIPVFCANADLYMERANVLAELEAIQRAFIKREARNREDFDRLSWNTD